MNHTGQKIKGILFLLGARKYGLYSEVFYACPDCATEYPVIENAIRCNGETITVCPYCHPEGNAKARGEHLTGQKEARP